ncbi:GNAT family N-acetyltransferase [Arenibacterium halophilum]|nr:GNAT family N-acetyltransferase [Arenibacterium halophilum]
MTPEQMAALHLQAFRVPRPWSAGEFRTMLERPGTFAMGDTRAFALVSVIHDEAELLTIATDPALRRQGLARAVMQDWQAEAARRGATRAFLEVAADNKGAQALYATCGYVEAGRRKGYYAHPDGTHVDAVVMQRTLT